MNDVTNNPRDAITEEAPPAGVVVSEKNKEK